MTPIETPADTRARAPAEAPEPLAIPEVVVEAGRPPRIGSLVWDDARAPEPRSLPRFALRAVMRGDAVVPQHVALRWMSAHGAWFIGFFEHRPADPCDFRWFREPGFQMRLHATRPVDGDAITRVETTETFGVVDQEPDLVGAVDVYPDGVDVNPYHSASGAAMAIAFDRVGEARVEGRVYVAGRSSAFLLAGAFEGIVCPEQR